MKIAFTNYGVALANKCIERLESSGIHELKLLDTLMVGQKRLLLCYKEFGKDFELYIQRTSDDIINKISFYRFIVIEHNLTDFKHISAEFNFVNEDEGSK